MKIDFDYIKVIPAEIDNEEHQKAVWIIKNKNIEYSLLSNEKISYENHCEWWKRNFEKEYVYIILYQSKFIGYIRLTKQKTNSLDKNEISIAFSKKFQKKGIGTYVYKIFENCIKQFDISRIIATTHVNNEAGQKFFEKNNFVKKTIESDYVKFIKNI